MLISREPAMENPNLTFLKSHSAARNQPQHSANHQCNSRREPKFCGPGSGEWIAESCPYNGQQDQEELLRRAISSAALASAVCVAAVGIGQQYVAGAPSHQVHEAYFEGQLVPFHAERDSLITRSFTVGAWRFGRRVHAKPRDGRLNLYVLSPGDQYPAEAGAPYSFNCVVNALPKQGAEVEWDVYWAIVLDPTLTDPIHDEKELLLATQAEFAPTSEFRVQDVPGYELLRRYLRISTMSELDHYRRKSGELPRVLIVPAHIVLKATAGEPVESAK
jgi:hypothetical protein